MRDNLKRVVVEVSRDRLDDILMETEYLTPVLAPLTYLVEPRLIESQFAEDYIDLDNDSRLYCDDFVSSVLGLASIAKECNFTVLMRHDQYVRNLLQHEIDTKKILRKNYPEPFDSKRLIKSVFPMFIINEKEPECICTLINMLDMTSDAMVPYNKFTQINRGYTLYRVTPDEIKFTDLHVLASKTGACDAIKEMNTLKLYTADKRVPISLRQDIIYNLIKHN